MIEDPGARAILPVPVGRENSRLTRPHGKPTAPGTPCPALAAAAIPGLSRYFVRIIPARRAAAVKSTSRPPPRHA